METSCPVCEGKRFSSLFLARDYITHLAFAVARCDACRLVQVNPQPAVDELGRFYPELYYGEQPFFYEKVDAASRFRQVSRQVKAGDRVLDVGCGRGLVLAKLRARGCEVVGTELSAHSSKYAREQLGLEILQKNLMDCTFPDNAFDCITLFHSLEHLPVPSHELRELRRIVKPGGKVLVEVPRFDSFYSKIFRDKWFHLDVPRHLYHFEDDTLLSLLEQDGFEVMEVKKYDFMYDSFGAVQSLLNCVCSEFNLLNDLNTKRKSMGDLFRMGTRRQKADVVLSLAGQVILYPLFVLLAFALAPFNVGGTLRVWARKRLAD